MTYRQFSNSATLRAETRRSHRSMPARPIGCARIDSAAICRDTQMQDPIFSREPGTHRFIRGQAGKARHLSGAHSKGTTLLLAAD